MNSPLSATVEDLSVRLEAEGNYLMAAVYRRIASILDRESAIDTGAFKLGERSSLAVCMRRKKDWEMFWNSYRRAEGDGEFGDL